MTWKELQQYWDANPLIIDGNVVKAHVDNKNIIYPIVFGLSYYSDPCPRPISYIVFPPKHCYFISGLCGDCNSVSALFERYKQLINPKEDELPD